MRDRRRQRRPPDSRRTASGEPSTDRKLQSHQTGGYRDSASLDAAYEGGAVLLLISGLDLGKRMQEHRNAIAAAKKAGIRHIVDRSVGGVQRNNPPLSAKDHDQTSLDLRASG